MTYPVFSAGEVLRATDMNAVGLWLVKSQAVGSGVSSVTVTGAFSADYDNYRVTYSGGTQSASADVEMVLGGSTTGYYGFLNYGQTTAGTPLGAAINNSSKISWLGGGEAGQASHLSVDLMNPFLAMYTKFRNGSYQNTNIYGVMNGEHRVAASYSSFTIQVLVGSLTGGTIRVYGYKN